MKQPENRTSSIDNTDNIDTPRTDIARHFLLIKKDSEEFGYIAIKRGYATLQDVKYALEQQQKLFREKQIKKMIGEILLESGVLTKEQYQNIRKAQQLVKMKREEKDATNNINKLAIPISPTPAPLPNGDGDNYSLPLGRGGEGQNTYLESYRTNNQIDNRVEVTISANGMEAWVKIVIPQDTSDSTISEEKEQPITLISIKSALANKGVKNGILSDAILQSHLDRKDDFFPAALGTYHYSHLPEFQFSIDNKKTTVSQIDKLANPISTTPLDNGEGDNYSIPLGRVGDGQNIIIESLIVGSDIIKKGKALALINSEKGQNKAQDVFGKVVNIDSLYLKNYIDSSLPLEEIDMNYSKLSLIFRCGKWVSLSEFSEDKLKITAEHSGYPALSLEGKFYTFPVVNVLGDADLRFGQIQQYASVNVSGTLTGAYPVNAGQVKANEIRRANVLSIGDISVEVGIINSRIKTQGSVRAKYIHASRIEAFGDVVVEHEIIDSTIIISGKCNVYKGRVLASEIYAKMGFVAIRVGSNLSEPCVISVGCEEHIILKSLEITRQINNVRKELDELIRQRESLESEIKEIFKKMVELKVAYDKESSNLKEMVDPKVDYDKANANLKEMVEILKKHNKQKKTLELSLEKIEININKIKPKVERDIAQLELDRNLLLRWAESKSPLPEIKISGRLSDETILLSTLVPQSF